MSPSMETASEHSLREFRAELHEIMTFVGCYAGMVQSMVEVGDDHGAAYSLRKAFAYMRHALGVYNDLSAALKRAENSEAA